MLIDPYFSATKLRWILENVDGTRQRLRQASCFRHHRNVAHMETDRRKGTYNGLFQRFKDHDVQHTYSQMG